MLLNMALLVFRFLHCNKSLRRLGSRTVHTIFPYQFERRERPTVPFVVSNIPQDIVVDVRWARSVSWDGSMDPLRHESLCDRLPIARSLLRSLVPPIIIDVYGVRHSEYIAMLFTYLRQALLSRCSRVSWSSGGSLLLALLLALIFLLSNCFVLFRSNTPSAMVCTGSFNESPEDAIGSVAQLLYILCAELFKPTCEPEHEASAEGGRELLSGQLYPRCAALLITALLFPSFNSNQSSLCVKMFKYITTSDLN